MDRTCGIQGDPYNRNIKEMNSGDNMHWLHLFIKKGFKMKRIACQGKSY